MITRLKELLAHFYFGLFWLCLCVQAVYAQTDADYPPVPNPGIDTKIYKFGELNEGEYGSGAGTDKHPNGYGLNINLNDVANSPSNSTTETGCNVLYKFSYEIYDIDFDEEVRVYLNNVYLAYIKTTGEAKSVRRKIEFCGSLLKPGNNLFEFRVQGSNRVWSVKDILLKYRNINSINYNSDFNSALAFGNGFGTDKHPNYLVVNFNAEQDKSQVVSVRGWDIDQIQELSVYFNDDFIGRLTLGCNQCLGDIDRFELSDELMLPGKNQLLFVQRNKIEQWGLTDLIFRPKSNITAVINLLLL